MRLADLFSQEIKNALTTPGAFITFDEGWIFNRDGELGFILNVPAPTVQHPEFVSFGKIEEIFTYESL